MRGYFIYMDENGLVEMKKRQRIHPYDRNTTNGRRESGRENERTRRTDDMKSYKIRILVGGLCG